MKPADYLAGLLREQRLVPASQETLDLEARREEVEKVLRSEFRVSAPSIRYGGSKAKNTMIKECFDLDLICYFKHEDTKPGDTLEDVYENVRDVLRKKFKIREKTSAVRILGGDDVDFHVDVVPGRFTDNSESDAFLHCTSGKKERLKTNLQTHIDHVRSSGLTDAICLMKLWRERQGIELRTFPLELLVLELLKQKTKFALDDQLKHFWGELRDHADEIKIEDPANPTGNDLSEMFGEKERESLAANAALALEAVEAEKWEEIFASRALQKQADIPRSGVPIGDARHAVTPKWPTRATEYEVSISCRAHREHGGGFPLKNDGVKLPDGVDLAYRAETNVPEPFEIYWQVVNTGAHAKSDGGLRGDEFLPSRSRDRKKPAAQANVTWETTKYTGKHWIECFIVRNNEIWARSGPFYVNIVNRSPRGTIWWRKRGR